MPDKIKEDALTKKRENDIATKRIFVILIQFKTKR